MTKITNTRHGVIQPFRGDMTLSVDASTRVVVLVFLLRDLVFNIHLPELVVEFYITASENQNLIKRGRPGDGYPDQFPQCILIPFKEGVIEYCHFFFQRHAL